MPANILYYRLQHVAKLQQFAIPANLRLHNVHDTLHHRLCLSLMKRWSSSFAFRERQISSEHSYYYLLEDYPIIFEPNHKQLSEAQTLFTRGQNKFVTSILEYDTLNKLPYSLPEVKFQLIY